MKLIKTSNPKEIEWLLKERHVAKETGPDFKVFEVEEDVIVPDFSVTLPPPENKINKKKTDDSPKKKEKNKSSKNKR